MKKRIIISGFGGQGVMLAGTLLCYAGMKSGREVTFFPSYGAEMRGGTANCRVIVSDKTIGSPVFGNAHILIALNFPSYQKFSERVKKGGLVFFNSTLFKPSTFGNNFEAVGVDANNLAEKCGTVLAANMVMLGALVKKTGIMDLKFLTEAIPSVLAGKEKFWESNLKALNKGFKAVGGDASLID